MELAEIAVRVVAQVVATAYDLEPDQIQELAQVTPGERGALRAMAPSAIPYVSTWIGHAPAVAAGGFALILASCLYSRAKAAARLSDQERRAKPSRPSAWTKPPRVDVPPILAEQEARLAAEAEL